MARVPEPRRLDLAHLPTPLEPMDRLAAELGRPRGSLLIKRDDATGLAGGGNKTRKLEYLCADALARDADVLVTGGGQQSNHARQTAAAAARLGMGATLVLGASAPDRSQGNVVLDRLLGADIEWVGDLDHDAMEEAIDAVVERLRDQGRRPYRIPLGGANTVGAYAYLRAAREILDQAPDVDLVVTADGTGGTHAGLAAGMGDHDRVMGVDVGARDGLERAVARMAQEVAGVGGVPHPVGNPRIDRFHIGAGYAVPSVEGLDAIRLVARCEGILLDPVYSGKAMAALLTALERDSIRSSAKVVFLHTGGMPALFTESFRSMLDR